MIICLLTHLVAGSDLGVSYRDDTQHEPSSAVREWIVQRSEADREGEVNKTVFLQALDVHFKVKVIKTEGENVCLLTFIHAQRILVHV